MKTVWTSIITCLAFNLIWNSPVFLILFLLVVCWLGSAHLGRILQKDKRVWSDILYIAGPLTLIAIFIENQHEKTRSN